MKKFIKAIALTAMITVLASCGGTETSSTESESTGNQETSSTEQDTSDVEKITVWAWDPNFNVDIMNNAKERYESNNDGVMIEVVDMAKGDLEQLLHTDLASGVKTNLPDIVLIEDYNAQKYLQSYPGAFKDLTNDFNYDDFANYKVELMKLGDSTYGVPFDSGVTGFFYRKDVLAEAGYAPEDLQNLTWDEFINIGLDVKEKTGKALLSFGRNDGGIMRVMMQSAGEWYFNADGSLNMAGNPVLLEALEAYKKIVESEIIIPTTGWTDWVGAFNSGDAVSVSTGAWIIGSVKSAEDQAGLWGLAPIPRLSNDSSINASNLGGSSWYVLDTDNSDTAIKFLQDTYGSDVEFYQDILVKNGAIGSYIPAYEGEAYEVADEFFDGQQIYIDLSNSIKNVPSINYGLYTYEADSAIMGLIEEFYAGRMTAEEVLVEAEKVVDMQIN